MRFFARMPRGLLLLCAFLVGAALVAGCEVREPIGQAGALGRAEFTSSLDGALGPTPLAQGARFVVAASRDGCDRLRETCSGPYGELLVTSSDPAVLEVTPRSDGALGALARAPGSALLFAVDGDERVVDWLDVEVAVPAGVGLTDQPATALAPLALPADWGVAAGEDVDLRAVLFDRQRRVLLTGDDPPMVSLELRDFGPTELFRSSLIELGGLAQLRSPAFQKSGRLVVRPTDGSADAKIYYLTVGPPTGHGRLRIEPRGFVVDQAFGLTHIDLCAVHELGGLFQVGHRYEWAAPEGFAIRGLGIGPFSDEPPEGSRCVRAVRWDDREIGPNERFGVLHGPSQAELPFGVIEQRTSRPEPWYAPALELGQSLLPLPTE